MSETDPRRHIPRTDDLLALPEVAQARNRLSDSTIRALIDDVQSRARNGTIPADSVRTHLADALAATTPSSMMPVINATGVIIHTNLGRAPLSHAAVNAMVAASGYVDVELDLATGQRSKRGMPSRAALRRACPAAQDALIVNNGAAALVLATTAFAADREVVVSRGELIEIGAGFRLTDLITSTGARLREVGTTNRTHARDYTEAITAHTGCILKIHPSNYRISGFTTEVTISALRPIADEHDVPLIADLGSGLLHPDPALPDEPDATTALTAGADLVIASGDKLLGGPQAGIIVGRADFVARLAAHPLARAVRADKLALAALEATVSGPPAPIIDALHADPERLRQRAEALADAIDGAQVVAHDGRVGGGGAPEVPLPGYAVSLPVAVASRLRVGEPAVLPRVSDGQCLIDLRCVPEADDARLTRAVLAAVSGSDTAQVDP